MLFLYFLIKKLFFNYVFYLININEVVNKLTNKYFIIYLSINFN